MTGPMQPMGVPRMHLKEEDGKLVNGATYPGDAAWLPSYDPAFKAWAKRLAVEFGWPKGPINAMKLWNEPWEGGSIAMWHADMLRYREIFTVLCGAVEEARREVGVRILLGGADSSSNTMDKHFPDGDDQFLQWTDFMSIHYQAMSPAAGIRMLADRKHYGRTLVWDTESWCANSDERIIHDAPHAAILFGGNEILIEGNEIHRACLETGDVGAIYAGRDYTYRGNVIRRNFIHHMGGVGCGSMGVYMDDCVSGTRIVENVLWECQHGIFLGGGRDFEVENNVLADCRMPIYADARGAAPTPVWQNMVNVTMRQRLEAMRCHEPPYLDRYPELAGLDVYLDAGMGVPPEHNRTARNIIVRQSGSFEIIAEGAALDRNLYWCAAGPILFACAGTSYWSHPLPGGFLNPPERFDTLDNTPGVTTIPDEQAWRRAMCVNRFYGRRGTAEAPAGLGELRFLRQGAILHVRGAFTRPAGHRPSEGGLWSRERVELFLKPVADCPGHRAVRLGHQRRAGGALAPLRHADQLRLGCRD